MARPSENDTCRREDEAAPDVAQPNAPSAKDTEAKRPDERDAATSGGERAVEQACISTDDSEEERKYTQQLATKEVVPSGVEDASKKLLTSGPVSSALAELMAKCPNFKHLSEFKADASKYALGRYRQGNANAIEDPRFESWNRLHPVSGTSRQAL